MSPLIRRCCRRARRDDRGEVSIETVILMPVLILLIMLGVQAATWYHAANVAQSAAAQGAAAGAVRDAGNGAASARAQQVIDESGALGSASASGGFAEVSVQVTVNVAHLVPFFPDTVTVSASEARERFIPEDQR